MPSKRKKSKSKRTKSKVAAAKRAKKTLHSKRAAKPGRPKAAPKKKQAKKKSSSKTSAVRGRKRPITFTQSLESSSSRQGAVSDRQSGDLRGLSRAEQADSESVDELVEEGNLFEAGAVSGVEEADSEDEREVHTHEVPEDDVPGEYLDED